MWVAHDPTYFAHPCPKMCSQNFNCNKLISKKREKGREIPEIKNH
jgi:hypothetical protein